MDISTLLEKVPPSLVPVVIYFPFFVGVLAIARVTISYVRMLLSVFVLPGTNVRSPSIIHHFPRS
jgi:17beta-estradiol 17-dehydrogenase / very-long-chain 3-oxoacyl-CoA reductase